VTKLSVLSESPVRIDPVGKATGILPILLGEVYTHLAKLADPAPTSQQFRFSLALASLCCYMLEHELQKLETKLHMVLCSGMAVVWMLQINGFKTLFGRVSHWLRSPKSNSSKQGEDGRMRGWENRSH
jgi:hypothetical protein